MRHSMTVATIALLAMAMTACKGKTEETTKAQSDTIVIDAASIAAAAAQQPQVFTSPDLSFYELKGHVKSCTVISYGEPKCHKFDRDGRITNSDKKLGRDSQGRIISSTEETEAFGDITDEYAYDSQGRLVREFCNTQADLLSYDSRYTYDGDRRMGRHGSSDGLGPNRVTYRYISEDEQGNWTKRQEITYTTEDGNEEEVFNETVTRTIEYYQ